MADPPVGSREWLRDLIHQKCGFIPREYQLTHGLDLIAGKDLFLVIAPGMGKTTVFHAPLLAAQARGEQGICIIIVPTKLLGEQQEGVAKKCGLRALAINEDTVRKAHYAEPKPRNLFDELSTGGDIRIGIMSPQMLQSYGMQKLLSNTQAKAHIRWFFIDEGHLVREKTGPWRLAYQPIQYMRSRLLSSATWATITGTATPSGTLEIAHDLGFRSGLYVNARYSVDRPNLKIIPRFLEHSVSGYVFLDLSFLIPFDLSAGAQIPTTIVFCETIEFGWKVMNFLDQLLPASIPHRKRIIQLYNAIMPVDYRHQFMSDLSDGSVLRIGVCTDTCTYGLDVPNVQRVVLFGVAPSMNILKQRMHRAGRDGAPAVVYTFAPTWVREVSSDRSGGKQAKLDAVRREALSPVIRQWYNPTLQLCPRHADLVDNEEPFVQPAQCCSVHNPEPQQSADLSLVTKWKDRLEEESRTAESASKPAMPRSDGTYHVLKKSMKTSLTRMLEQWRGRMWISIRDVRRLDLPSQCFLPNYLISLLVDKAHLCTSLELLRRLLPPSIWKYSDQYSAKLFDIMKEILQGFQEILHAQYLAEQQNEIEAAAVKLEEEIEEVESGEIAEVKAGVSATRVRLLVRQPVETDSSSDKGKRVLETSNSRPSKRQRRDVGADNKENNTHA
ncbi:P-loop containing nucleoside triphosphate hydrolase protein [Amylocystis lapponica]|nr:P-loop containing nucleoside triphosphate hydrolase protein [Amylocystis lapponica]KAH9947562.1 P-loop containing nucleoside triphosphate hydrolase protein [Amylocystis lapponica]